MTGPRIVRLETADQGEVTFECPAWCVVPHTAGFGTHADEIVHYDEPDFVGPVANNQISMQVSRCWQPYGTPEQTVPYLSADVTLTVYAATPEQLETAAATLEVFAAELRGLAPKLAELQEEER